MVAGGSGFVGSHFVLQLLEQGAQVRVPTHIREMEVHDPRIEIVKGDLTSPEDCLRMLKDIEIVVNASGAVSAAGVDQVRHMEIIARNLITSVRLIQAAWIAGVERFLVLEQSHDVSCRRLSDQGGRGLVRPASSGLFFLQLDAPLRGKAG